MAKAAVGNNRLTTRRAAPHRQTTGPAEPVALPQGCAAACAPLHQAFIPPRPPPWHWPVPAPAAAHPGQCRAGAGNSRAPAASRTPRTRASGRWEPTEPADRLGGAPGRQAFACSALPAVASPPAFAHCSLGSLGRACVGPGPGDQAGSGWLAVLGAGCRRVRAAPVRRAGTAARRRDRTGTGCRRRIPLDHPVSHRPASGKQSPNSRWIEVRGVSPSR